MDKKPVQHQTKFDKYRVLTLHGVDYYIYWEDLRIGSSFFLPTTASVAQVSSALRPVARGLKFELTARARREYGRYGVRVWRVL